MNGLVFLTALLGLEPASSALPATPGPNGPIIENPERPEGALVESPQVASAAVGRADEPLTTTQISPARREVGQAGQVSRSGDRAPTGQVSRGERSAASAEPLSRPADGRATALVRLEGEDRCDPRAAPDQRAGADCARVIETRSEEFRRIDSAILSPEQRLLIEQRARERSSESVARRIANGAVDPNLPEDQAIASLTLDGPVPPTPEKPKEDLPAGADALINAIVNRIVPQN